MSGQKNLLVDTVTNIRFTLDESAQGGKVIARGQFALCDVRTANNRIYRRGLWEREIKRLQKAIQERKVFGEADHPADGRTKLSRASHIITGLRVEDDGQVIGEAEIMDTSSGKDLKAILSAGGSLGVSSRGYGSVKLNENGEDVVQDDFLLETFDFVVDPAQSTAYPEIVTGEGKEAPAQAVVVEQDKTAAKESEVKLEETAKVEQAVVVPSVEQLQESLRAEYAAKLVEAVAEAKNIVREELTSELMSDPKIAGARLALESVKNTLRPFILPEDVNKVMEGKEEAIAALTAVNGKLEEQVKVLESEKTKMALAVKDLGFNLYLTKNLGQHPKFEDILKSLGDLSLIESLDDLKKRTEIYVKEMVEGAEQAATVAAEEAGKKDQELANLKEQARKLYGSVKKLTEERDHALAVAKEAALKVYLERKISGNAKASAIRQKFEALEAKTKDSVDRLVEGFENAAPYRGARDFDAVRRRMKGLPSVNSNLVEDSLKGTVQPVLEKKLDVVDGVQLAMSEFDSLAGVR